MSDRYAYQRFVFQKARENGWPGREPDVLGNPEAERLFDSAKAFLLSLNVSYQKAAIWFSGTCKSCGAWSHRWNDHTTAHVICPCCGAQQSVHNLTMHESKRSRRSSGTPSAPASTE